MTRLINTFFSEEREWLAALEQIKMPLTEFPLLQDNTRLLKHKDTLYKVKVKYDESTVEANGAGITRKKAHAQIENTFRAILYLIQREATLTLKPIQTENFLISIDTSPWSFSQRYGFLQNEKELKSYPLQFEFRVKVQGEGKQDRAISEFKKVESLKGSHGQKHNHSLDTDIVDAKDHSARFTRNSRGSLLHDGKKVVTTTDKTQATKEIDSQRARDNPKTNKVLSEDRKIGLKRKLNRSPQKPTKLAKSDDEDKGLEVERFHNRNNSNLSATSEYSGYRLRDRSSRNFSPVSDLGTRHSERIRARETLENNNSISSVSYQRHTRSKLKRSSSLDTAGIDSEKNDYENDDIYPIDPGNNSGVIKDSRSLSSEVDHSQHTTRKLKRNRKDKFENKLDEIGADKITDGEKHCEPSQSNKIISEKDANEIDRSKKDGSKRRIAKDNNTSSPKTKKHRLYTENEGPVLIANQKPSITGR